MLEIERYRLRDKLCIVYDEAKRKYMNASRAYHFKDKKDAKHLKLVHTTKSNYILAKQPWLDSCKEYNRMC